MSKKIKMMLEVTFDGSVEVDVDHEDFKTWFEESGEKLSGIEPFDVIEFIQSGRDWQREFKPTFTERSGFVEIDGGRVIEVAE